MFGLISLLHFHFLISDSMPVIDKWSIYSGDIFSVTCDLRSFEGLSADETSLTQMSLERITAFDTEFVNVATYGNNPPIKSIPHGRSWTIIFNDGKEEITTPAIITLYVREACCGDAGMYRCTATKNDSEAILESDIAELKCNDLPEKASIRKEINAKGNTQYLCSFSTMLALKVQWRYTKQSSGETFTYDGTVHTIGPVISYNCRGCKEYFYLSKLVMEDSSEAMMGNTYFCTGYNDTTLVT